MFLLAVLNFNILLLLLICTTFTQSNPLPNSKQKSPDPIKHSTTWDFDLYQNRQCTGPTGIYTGHGSSGCRTDILNGGALAYIPVDIDSRCTVNLFRDDNCTSGARIGMVRVDSVRKCSPVAGKNTMVASFEVVCS